MKYQVNREFKDKFRQVRYYTGDVYESEDAERITFLQSEGYIGAEIKPPRKPAKKKVKSDGDT